MKYEIPSTPDPDTDDHIINRTLEYNAQFVWRDHTPLSVYCRDDVGEIIGGLTGYTYWSYLDIEFLWVDECHRKRRIGTEIMSIAEEEAKSRGCKFAMLDTFEFQALGFYQKIGYEQFGKLEGYCDKYERFYLRKAIS